MDQSEAAGSGGGGASCIAALTRLSLHHHLPGNAGDLTVGHRTWDPRPERRTERKPLLTLDTGQKFFWWAPHHRNNFLAHPSDC